MRKKHEIYNLIYHCTARGCNISLSSTLRYYLIHHGKPTQITFSLLGIGIELQFTTVISAWLNVGRSIQFLSKVGKYELAFQVFCQLSLAFTERVN